MKVAFFFALFAGCVMLATASFAQSDGAQAMKPKEVYAVTYATGPQWKHGPDKQDLASHLNFVAKAFKVGQLGIFTKITVPVRAGGLCYRASTRREGHSRAKD